MLKFLILAAAMTGLTMGDTPSPLEKDAVDLASRRDTPGVALIHVACGFRDFAVAGVTRLGGQDPITSASRFNLGSNSKAVLATAIAIEAESGSLDWNTEVSQSGLIKESETGAENQAATLRDLLSHTAGIATYHTGSALREVTVDGPASDHPRQFAIQALQAPRVGPRGTYAYSNAGPVIAAVMIEQATHLNWYEVIEKRVLGPWGLKAQLGDPAPEDASQPFGHYMKDGVLTVYDDPSPEIDPFLQPSGYLSFTPQGYARFLELHVCGLNGKDAPGLSAEGIKFLHTAVYDTPSALGWARGAVNDRMASYHVGATGTHYAIALVEELGAWAVLINSNAPEATAAAQAALIRLHAEGTNTENPR